MAETILVQFQSQGADSLSAELGQISDATEQVEKSQTSLRAQLRQNQQALAALAVAGKQNTDEYKKLRDEAGKLKDAISDAAAEIKQAGSDTRGLDKAIRATNVLVGGFAAVQGATALFGKENENLQKTLLKVNAAMSILAGLQQIQEELTRKDSIFTSAATKAKNLYALAVGRATGAMKLFRLALAATGIGALVLILGTVIANWDRLSAAITRSFPAFGKVAKFFKDFQFYMVGTAKSAVSFFRGLGDAFSALISGKFKQAVVEIKDIPAEMKTAFRSGFEESKKAAEEAKSKQAAADAGQKLGKEFGKTFKEEVKKSVNESLKDSTTPQRTAGRLSRSSDIESISINELIKPAQAYTADYVELAKQRSEADLAAAQQSQKIEEEQFAKRRALAEEYVNYIADTYGRIFSVVTQSLEAQQSTLEQQRKAGIITERQYQAKLKELREKQAKSEKANAIFNIILNTSQAITKALTAGPIIGPILAGIIGALAIAQLSIVKKQPVPKFKKGVIDLQGPGTETSDSIPAMLSKRESVMTAEETKNYKDVLWAIRKNTFDKMFMPVDEVVKKHKPMPLPFLSSTRTNGNNIMSGKLDKIYEELVYQNIYTKEGNRVLYKSNNHLEIIKAGSRNGIRV